MNLVYWVCENKEALLSVLVFLVGVPVVFRIVHAKNKQTIKSGDGSVNIQGGGNVDVEINKKSSDE